jgi:hypothetical protein
MGINVVVKVQFIHVEVFIIMVSKHMLSVFGCWRSLWVYGYSSDVNCGPSWTYGTAYLDVSMIV